MNKRLSIIITAHNYGRWIKQAIESAINVTWSNLEVIIVDDGSTDNTPEIIKQYEKNPIVKTITLPELGLAAACNRGIDISTGDYIIRLDADDYLDPNIAIVFATYLDNKETVDLVYGDYFIVNEENEILSLYRQNINHDESTIYDRPALGAGTMYRKECIEDIGGYDESLNYQEHYDFWLRFIKKYNVAHVPLPLMYYRKHGSSMSTNWEDKIEDRQKIKNKYAEAYAGNDIRISACILTDNIKENNPYIKYFKINKNFLFNQAISKLNSNSKIKNIFALSNDKDIKKVPNIIGIENALEIKPTIPAYNVKNIRNQLIQLYNSIDTKVKIVVFLNPLCTSITEEHIDEAINTINIFDVDQVIALAKEPCRLWRYGTNGLEEVISNTNGITLESRMFFQHIPGFCVLNLGKLFAGDEDRKLLTGHIEV